MLHTYYIQEIMHCQPRNMLKLIVIIAQKKRHPLDISFFVTYLFTLTVITTVSPAVTGPWCIDLIST